MKDLFAEYNSHKGTERNYLDLDEAIKNAREHISPTDKDRATDGKEENNYTRNLEENIRLARERRAKDMAAVSNKDREARIDDYIRTMNSEMSKRGIDGLRFTARGYDAALLKVPAENADPKMTMNGKPVHIHPDLTGDAVYVRGDAAEMSRDLLDKANREMTDTGKMRWEKEVEGHSVIISADIRINGKQARVDNSLMPGQAELEKAGSTRVSPDLWKEAYENIKADNPRWGTHLENGAKVDAGIKIELDGKPVVIDQNLGEGQFTEEQGIVSISREDYNKAVEGVKDGKGDFSFDLESGETIKSSPYIKINNEKASIDDTLKGHRVVREEAGARLSPDLWDKAWKEIISSPNPSKAASRLYDTEGRKIEVRMDVKVDGKEAVPNRPMEKGEVREGRNGVEVSREFYEEVKQKMDSNKETVHKESIRDGREITFQREGDIKLYINGREINDGDFRDAVAEMAGLDNERRRDLKGATITNFVEQAKIQGIRGLTSSTLSIPSKTVRGVEHTRDEGRSVISHILGMAMQNMSRGMSR